MGLLRVLFAFSIFTAHTNGLFGFAFLNQQLAVCSFFIISGFYMSLVLDAKYKSYRLFITNRFLRIFPLYWTMLTLLFVFSLIKYVTHTGVDNAISHYLQYYTNTSPLLFGLDLFNFILRNITLIFTFDYVRVGSQTPGYLLVQQAWTLQLELIFYLLVPLLMRLSPKKFFLVVLGQIFIFYGFLLPHNVFDKLSLLYVFLFYFLYFLLGMISYKLYKLVKKLKLKREVLIPILILFVLYLICYNLIPFRLPFLNAYDAPYYIALIVVLPFIFLLTNNIVLDLVIGELAYPIYISHIFFIKIFANIPIFKNSAWAEIFLMITVLLASILMVLFIEKPINRIRQKRLADSQKNKKKV